MLLTIFNLPAKTRYADIKSLIHSKCGLKDVILDNLTQAGDNSKKVTVGLAEEEDAAILSRKINGFFMEGQQLYVETIKKKQVGGPGSLMNQAECQQPTPQQPYYQQSYQQPSYQLGYADMQNGPPSMDLASMSFGGMYGAQNAFANYGYPQQMPYQQAPMMPQSMVNFDQGAPLGFNNQGNNPSVWSDQNDWNTAGNASGGNQVSHQNRTHSKWDHSGGSNSQPLLDAPDRDYGRDGPSRNFGRDTASRDFGRNAPPRNFGRDVPSRDYGRDASSRDRGRDAPRDYRRDAPFPDRGREGQGRDRGRDALFRNASAHEHGRDAPYRRNEPDRTASKRQFSSHDSQPKSSSSNPKIFGEHVTNPSAQMRKYPQQRDGPKRFNKQAPNKTLKAPGDYNPPSKRQRKGVGSVNQSDTQKANIPAKKVQAQTPSKKKNKLKNNPEMFAARAATWRHQIASSLAKEIIKNPELKNDIVLEQFLPELKRAIRYRLETLFGDDHEIRMADMLKLYREKYDTDTDADFFNEVTEEIKKNGSYLADDMPKAVPGDKNEAADPQSVQESADTVKKIPSYPVGDKKTNKALKKENALIFKDEETLPSQMEPSMQKALNEEIDEMCAAIAEEFQDETSPEYKDFDERIKTTVIKNYKKMIKINLAKRILNVGPIMLRIFNVPKTVARTKLAPVLAEYGITSLRKSERKRPSMYFGSCSTYDEHDKLISMEPIVVDGSTVLIKPFHLTGKLPKMSKDDVKTQRKNITKAFKNMDECPIGYLEEMDDEVDEDILKLNTDYEQTEGRADDEDQGEQNPEIMETEIEEKGADATETVEDTDTNKHVKVKLEDNESQEINVHDSTEKAKTTEAEGVKTEINNKGTENNSSKSTEDSNTPAEVEKDNNTEDKNAGKAGNETKRNKENLDETILVENIDFTEDVDINNVSEKDNAFKVEKDLKRSVKPDTEKDLTEINPKDLIDFVGRKNYDDIDIADLNDDDLEDW